MQSFKRFIPLAKRALSAFRSSPTKPMPAFKTCALWKDPDATLSRAMQDVFSLEWQSPEESHFWRYALKCRDCEQTYFFQFLEEIDWDGGSDEQITIYIPYEGEDALEALKQEERLSLLLARPQLRKESPMGSAETIIGWLTPGSET